jgi:hypothetical protein
MRIAEDDFESWSEQLKLANPFGCSKRRVKFILPAAKSRANGLVSSQIFYKCFTLA